MSEAYVNGEIYREWMRSPAWRRLSDRLIRERGCCEICGEKEDLVCHHTGYAFLMTKFEERQIQVLCRKHHRESHGIKEK